MQPKLKDNPTFTSKPLSFWKNGCKTLLLRKFKKSFLQFKKSFLQQIYNKPKTIQVKKPLFYHYPYSNNLISFKMTFIGLIFV